MDLRISINTAKLYKLCDLVLSGQPKRKNRNSDKYIGDIGTKRNVFICRKLSVCKIGFLLINTKN